MYKGDVPQALPLFQIITSKQNKKMDNVEGSNKKQKKKNPKPEVQVHKTQQNEGKKDDIKIHKTFSANFKSNRLKKHKTIEDDSENDDKIKEGNNEVQKKPKRKHLIKANDHLSSENMRLSEEINLIKNSLSKKEIQIVKLKDKLNSVQNFSRDILNENSTIKLQYEDLLVELEKLKTERQKCLQCNDLKALIRKNSNEFDLIVKQNKTMNEDINMLKNVIYRLNVQLERYQEKLRSGANVLSSVSRLSEATDDVMNQNEVISQNIQGHSDHHHTPISWGNVNSHTLGPLLDAYQDTIKEKEDIIQKYQLEISDFTGKMKNILEENETLHRKNVEDASLLKKTIKEFESLKTEMKNTKDQNEVLVRKCALKHEKVQELCKIYDHKILSLRRDYEILQEQYHKSRAELSSLQAKYQGLTETHETLKNDRQTQIPLTVHNSSVNECKRLFEELKIQYEAEKVKNLNQIKQLEEKLPNLEMQVLEFSAEKRELQFLVKTSEKQIKKLEQKLSEMQSSLTHTQISRDSCKRQLTKAIEFGKELVKEQESLLQQLSNRSKESKAAVRYGNSMVTKMDSLKMQLKTVQKGAYEELATVEQRLNQQDLSIESLKKEHELEISSLVKELKDKDELIARLIEHNAPAQPYLLYRDRHVQFS